MNVLLVEDNPADAWLVKDLIFKEDKSIHLTLLDDGAKAENYLVENAAHHTVPNPDVVILDLNLPKMDGRAVLKKIKSTPELKEIPVFIFTSSKLEKDKDECLKLGASLFLTKPFQLSDFVKLVQELVDIEFPKYKRCHTFYTGKVK